MISILTFLLFPSGFIMGAILAYKLKPSRERVHVSVPIPFAKRKPTLLDCDEAGQCWMGEAGRGVWELRPVDRKLSHHTCWAARWEMPVPVYSNGEE
jgi:hypothetical protein